MSMNKFLLFGTLTALLAGCGGGGTNSGIYNTVATSNPTDVQESFLYATSLYGSDDDGPNANIAVLLPMSGSAKSVGNDIKTSIETAFLRKPKANVKISFYDLSGNINKRHDTIREVLNTYPDVVIGPLFAEDARILRDEKPDNLPVISFTSDVNSLGDGVMSVNLIPTQSIETIIRQIQSDGSTGLVIFAPNNTNGQSMLSVADTATDLYNVPVSGIFYYDSGNSESIKNAVMRASLYGTRKAVNNRAREILSDILTKETISRETRRDLSNQLEKISRTETLGKLPYDSVLFLGNGDDSKTIASFLRYYGVNNRDVAFYGTALWQNSDIASDFTLYGARYATLPEISDNFTNLYNSVAGKQPDYLAAFGYDAANMALGKFYTQKSGPAYFFDPSGYIGTTGIFRIQPTGESEHALRIVELNNSPTPKTIKDAPNNFLIPLYNIHLNGMHTVSEQPISISGINPGDYINIPEELRRKSEYRTKKIGANYVDTEPETKKSTPAQIPVYVPTQPQTEPETVSNPEFEPQKLESVSRQYIDNVEIEE